MKKLSFESCVFIIFNVTGIYILYISILYTTKDCVRGETLIISSKLKVTNESSSSVVYTTVNVYIEEILEEAIKHHDDAKRDLLEKETGGTVCVFPR